MKRTTKIVFEIAFFGILFLFLGMTYWLLYTTSGLNWSLKVINRAADSILEYRSVQGAWLTQMQFEYLAVNTPTLDIEGNNLQLEISINHLMSGTLDIVSAQATTITLQNKPSPSLKEQESKTQQGDFSLPVGIDVHSLKIDTLSFEQPRQAPIVLQHIAADESRIKRRIDIGSLTANTEFGEITLSGSLVPAINGDVELETEFTVYAVGKMPQLKGTAELSGAINNLSLQARLVQPNSIQVNAKLTGIDSTPKWQAEINANDIPLREYFPQIPLMLSNVKIQGGGDFTEYTVEGLTTVKHQEFGQWDGRWALAKSQSQWRIDSLGLTNTQTQTMIEASATINADYVFNSSTDLSLQVNWQNLQWPLTNSALVTSENGRLSLAGNFNDYHLNTQGMAAWSGNEISNISIAANGTPSSLMVSNVSADLLQGNIKGSGTLAFEEEIRWRAETNLKSINLHALYAKLDTTLDSKISVEGAVHKEQINSTFSISRLKGQVNKFPVAGRAQIALDGRSFKIEGLKLRSGDSRLSGGFTYLPGNKPQSASLDANWDVYVNDLQVFAPDFQGSVTSHGSINGAIEQLIGKVKLQATKFHYQDYTLEQANLDADVDLTEKRTSHISLGMRQAKIGEMPVDGLQMDIAGGISGHNVDLVLTQDAKNQLIIRGNGAWQENQWQFSTQETLIRTGQFGQWRQREPVSVNAAADTLTVSKLCVVRGYAVDSNPDNTDDIRGDNIDDGSVGSDENKGNPDNITDSNPSEEIAGRNAEICGSLDSKNFQRWESELRIHNIPLALFREFLPPQFDSTDVDLNGQGHFKYTQQSGALLDFKANGENGIISGIKIEGKDTTVEFNHIEFALSNVNRKLESIMSISIQDTGNVELAFAFPNWSKLSLPPYNERIQGHVEIDLTNLTMLAILSNYIKNPVGTWHSDIDVSGTLEAPLLIGESRVKASSLTLTTLGLTLRDVDLKAVSDAKRAVKVSGNARSGSGKINIKGSLNDYRASETTGSIKITGEDFELARIPEATIIVSPDLQLSLNRNAIEMTGDILISEAELTIFTPTKTITPSPDVVIVSKEQSKETPLPLNISSKIRIILGEKVKVQGYGFKGRLGGSVLVDDTKALTTASGEINITEGKYSAYGTTLDIDSGSLSFAGSSIDNPLVNVRAQRRINDVVAGVLVEGNVQSPKIHLFSEPAMDDSNILSYIIIGQPLNAASEQDGKLLANAAASLGLLGGEKLAKEIGQRFGIDEIKIQTDQKTNDASLLLGKYLSPDFYVGYAIGIGNAVDTLQIQYKLTEQWVLKTSSGEQQKAEILFTIEKD
jgi:translocation and assembly module TamB